MRCVLKLAGQGYLKGATFMPLDKAEVEYTDNIQEAMTFTIYMADGEPVIKPYLPTVCKYLAWEIVPVWMSPMSLGG